MIKPIKTFTDQITNKYNQYLHSLPIETCVSVFIWINSYLLTNLTKDTLYRKSENSYIQVCARKHDYYVA